MNGYNLQGEKNSDLGLDPPLPLSLSLPALDRLFLRGTVTCWPLGG